MSTNVGVGVDAGVELITVGIVRVMAPLRPDGRIVTFLR
jgi:hypothetical protein